MALNAKAKDSTPNVEAKDLILKNKNNAKVNVTTLTQNANLDCCLY